VHRPPDNFLHLHADAGQDLSGTYCDNQVGGDPFTFDTATGMFLALLPAGQEEENITSIQPRQADNKIYTMFK